MSLGSDPPWLDRKEMDNKKDESDWSKRRLGRIQANSGRGWNAKGDVRDQQFLWDNKQTQKGSYTITRREWRILQTWAAKEHRRPGLKITLMGDPDIEIVVIPVDCI